MNQLSKKPREENNLNRAFWKHDRRINLAKNEIHIFINAVKYLEEMGENRVSTDYMKSALLSVRQELQR